MDALKALIFDVDGTLADTERDGHRCAFNLAFGEHGLEWQWDEQTYGRLLTVAGGKERLRHYAERYDPAFFAGRDADALIRALHATKTRHYVRLAGSGRIPLRPGVGCLIETAIARGLRLAIATTTTPENVEALLSATLSEPVRRRFEVIGAGDVVAAKKPASDIYAWVLERLDLPPESCLAIEDSHNGLQAALGAGLRCLVNRNDYTRNEDFGGAWRVVDTLEGLEVDDL
ncbi:HAD family hydrolase [Dechloromonas sp.]|uniref:HAD family hydrolase n=1 Tax=Dechloromonas sp. TaxID=1917218 RepID=UPI0011FE1C0A|nr:HAD family hydrolase [Dechloromonas sp.]MBU3695295.1 HAD family hydrolase [Dechloromonas sp.]TEX48845.1 MAG: haloacid dehalogenase [Rhodocyclaceae bacterium]